MAVAAYAGQDVLKIHLKDGSTQTIAVSAIDSLTFEQMQSAGTFSVVDLTTKSVELKFVPAKTLGAFNIGVIKASDLNAFANDEAFCADQAKKFDADAKSWDMSLSEYLDFSLYKGNEIDETKTFPYSDLEVGTEYVAYAYGVNTADGTANTTVEKFTFTTESLLELASNSAPATFPPNQASSTPTRPTPMPPTTSATSQPTPTPKISAATTRPFSTMP